MILWECPTNLAPLYWPKARPCIEQALGRQDMGLIDGAEANVMQGAWQLWLAYEEDDAPKPWIGCGVCFIANECLFVVAWAGSLAHLELIPTMVKTMTGRVRAIRFIGQDSWRHVLGPAWKKIAVVYELDITKPGALEEASVEVKDRAAAIAHLVREVA